MFLVGYVLYWAIMVVSLRRDFAPPETAAPARHRPSQPLAARRRALATPPAAAVHGLGVSGRAADHRPGPDGGLRLGPLLALKLALVAALRARPGRCSPAGPARALIMVNFALGPGHRRCVGAAGPRLRTRDTSDCSIGSASACICWPRACGSGTCSSGRWSSARPRSGSSPPETAELLRERSLYLGGLGWPALAVLAITGLYLLGQRGIGPGDLVERRRVLGRR